MSQEAGIRRLLLRRTLTRDEQRQILEFYAPQLRLAGAEPEELFIPSAVDHFTGAGVLCLELRLLGRYAFWITPRFEGELQTPDLIDSVSALSDEDWGRWRRLLALTPLIDKGVSWRYAGAGDLEGVVDIQEPDESPEEQASQDAEMKSRTEWWVMGCGCLPMLLVLAGAYYLALRLFGQEVTAIAIPLAASLLIFGLATIVPQWMGVMLVYLSLAPICWLVTGAIWEEQTAQIFTVAWIIVVGLPGLIYWLAGRFKNLDQFIRGLMGRLSGLDDRTTRAVHEKARGGPGEPTYYGRLFRPQGASRWAAVLQYWFFYPMNDWRSTHGGINDHEADWETVQVFLPNDPLSEAKVAYSNHHSVTVQPLRGGQPLVFVGAGSHANYPVQTFAPFLRVVFNNLGRNPLRAILALILGIQNSVVPRISSFFLEAAAQAEAEVRQRPGYQLSRLQQIRKGLPPEEIPEPDIAGSLRPGLVQRSQALRDQALRGRGIVDRALGDGLIIGTPEMPWRSEVVDERTPWIRYSGRWGRSVFWHGEAGIGGPMYEQNGSPRLSWHDPIRWAGLPA